jgi:hypothetical protein
MKKIGLILRLILVSIVATSVSLGAQDVAEFPDISTLTPDTLFGSLYDPLYSALIIVFGYVSAFIPGVKKVSAFGRVLAFGLVAGLGFYLFGASTIKVAVSFLVSTGLLYDGFLKPLGTLILKKKDTIPSAPTNG